MRTDDEFTRLLAEVSQLNLIRESNAHLRSENESLTKRIYTLTTDLNLEKSQNIPLAEQVRILKSEKDALESSNSNLTVETNYWRERLHTLVSRYHDVDPEEHRILQQQYNTILTEKQEIEAKLTLLQQQLTETTTNNTNITTTTNTIIQTKEKEIDSLKSVNDSLDKQSNLLRQKLRDFKTKSDEQTKKLNETNKLTNEYKLEIERLSNELINTKNALINAQAAAAATASIHVPTLPAAVVPAPSSATVTIVAAPTAAQVIPAVAPATAAPVVVDMFSHTTTVQTTDAPVTTTSIALAATATAVDAQVTLEETDQQKETRRLQLMRETLLKSQLRKQKEAPITTAAPAPAPVTAPAASTTTALTTIEEEVSASEEEGVQQVSKRARVEEHVYETHAPATTAAEGAEAASSSQMEVTETQAETSYTAPPSTIATPTLFGAPMSSTYNPFSSSSSSQQLNPFAQPFSTSSSATSVAPPAHKGETDLMHTTEVELDVLGDDCDSDFPPGLLLSRQDTLPMESTHHEQGEGMGSGGGLGEYSNEGMMGDVSAESAQDTTTITTVAVPEPEKETGGAFLNLRPPSPVSNKSMTPVFGKKVATGSVETTSAPVQSSFGAFGAAVSGGGGGLFGKGSFATSTAPSPFSPFGSATTTGAGTTLGGQVTPKVIGSSIFNPSGSGGGLLSPTPTSTSGVPSVFGAGFGATSATNPFAAAKPFLSTAGTSSLFGASSTTTTSTPSPFGAPHIPIAATTTTATTTLQAQVTTSPPAPVTTASAVETEPIITEPEDAGEVTEPTTTTPAVESGESAPIVKLTGGPTVSDNM